MDCHPDCQTCFGPDNSHCYSCPEYEKLIGNECFKCNEITGFESSVQNQGLCIEICGDGLDYKEYECDDGNRDNLDGCDEFCQIEPGYDCENGNITSPDVCRDIIGPYCDITSLSSNF